MDVLVTTIPQDAHAKAVLAGLRIVGAEAGCIYMPNFPTMSRHSLRLSAAPAFDSTHPALHLDEGSVGAVWLRRPNRPSELTLDMEDKDAGFVSMTNAKYGFDLWDCLHNLLGGTTRWVHDPWAARRAQNKGLQLLQARKAGFRIPETLVSNDVAAVDEFIRSQPGGIIVKPHLPCMWTDDEGRFRAAYTTRLPSLDGVPAESVSTQSAIYQEAIEAEYEVRTCAIGDALFSIKIRKPHREDAILDWKARFPFDHDVEIYQLPANEESALRHLLRSLALQVASVDFIRATNGDLVFLEVNESGNFLWMEQMFPDFELLAAFISLLLGQELPNREQIQLKVVTSSDSYRDVAASVKGYVVPRYYGGRAYA